MNLLAGNLLARLMIRHGSPPSAILSAFLKEQRAAHPAEGGSREDWLTVYWAYQAALVAERYVQDPAAWEAANPEPTELLDWRAVAITEVHFWLDRELEGVGEGPEAADLLPGEIQRTREELVQAWAEHLPESWAMERIPWYAGPPHLLDVRDDIRALLHLPELVHLAALGTWQVVFRTKEKEHKGLRVLGSVKPLTAGERRLWPEQPAPLFRLELDWSYWAAMSGWTGPRGYHEARFRLLHHELGHCTIVKEKGKVRGHEMEEMGATLERYGASTLGEAVLIDRAYHHPRTQALLTAVPTEERSYLRPRSETPADGPVMPSADIFADDVRSLQDLVRERQARKETDYGAAPWTEIGVVLESLEEVKHPKAADIEQLRAVRALIRRWTPGVTL